MIDLLPRRAFVRFEIPLHYLGGTPLIDGNVGKWDQKYLLPPLLELEDEPAFADVYAAWNEQHLFVALDVPQRRDRLDAVIVYVHDKPEIDTPAFRKFIKQAPKAYLAACGV